MNAGPIFWGIFGILVGIFLFIFGLKELKKKRLIENIPTSKIRSLAMGLVEVFGKVVPSKSGILKSPFTKKDCVYYRYTIEEYRKQGKNSRWVTLRKEEKVRPFYIRDETGTVLVNPQKKESKLPKGSFGMLVPGLNAKMDIPLDTEFRSSWGQDPPQKVKDFLSSQNIRYEGILLKINKKMRYREYFIEPNDQLYVIGTAMDNPYVEEGSSIQSSEDIMIGKGKHNKIFYISDKPEKKILKNLSLKSFGSITFGSVIFVASLAFILFSMSMI